VNAKHALMVLQDHALSVWLVVTFLLVSVPFVRTVLTQLLISVLLVRTQTVESVAELVPEPALPATLAIWMAPLQLARHVKMIIVLLVVDQAQMFVQVVMKAFMRQLDSVLLVKTPIAKLALQPEQELAQNVKPTSS